MELLITCLNTTQKRFFVDTSLDTKLKKPFKTGCFSLETCVETN
jgi:hypothetical protein